MKKLCNLNKVKLALGVFVSKFLMVPMTVLAAGEQQATAADTLWDAFIGFLKVWVFRGGVITLFVGVVMFFVSLGTHDPSQKNTAIWTMVTGGGIAAAALALPWFFTLI